MNFKNIIAEKLAPCTGLGADALMQMIEIPPDSAMGDYALPCFKLAKTMRKAPQLIAEQLIQETQWPAFIARTEATKGYLNIYLDKTALTSSVLDKILTEKEQYGSSKMGEGKTICVDYSSINIAKPFGIHHLSSTALGNSLIKIYKHLGYKTVGMNFLGDWGTQFGKMIVAYLKWGDKAAVEKDGVKALVALYVKFHEEAEKEPALDDEARAWFKRIEDDDPKAMELFTWFKEITMEEVQRVYKLLGISFDDYNGESYFNKMMDPVIQELSEKGLLTESDGAMVVDLKPYDMPPCLFRRSDGATLYATRDIAASFWRKKNYDFDKCLYVVAYQQDLHFRQWFKVVELMGYPWYADLKHVAFGMMSMEDGAMSTRHGRVVWMEDVLNAAIERVQSIIEEKSPYLENKETVAAQVGIGAVLFSALYTNRIKDIVFSYDNILNFEGETAPYAQYTHARCCSVLRKAVDAHKSMENADLTVLSGPEAQALIHEMETLPEAVVEAADRNEPFIVARKVIAIAKAFNKYYYEQRILDGTDEEIAAKLQLCQACMYCIRIGLGLLGIAAPERM